MNKQPHNLLPYYRKHRFLCSIMMIQLFMISIVFWDGIPNLWHSLWINPTFCIVYDFTRYILQHSPSYRLKYLHLPSQYRIMNDFFPQKTVLLRKHLRFLAMEMNERWCNDVLFSEAVQPAWSQDGWGRAAPGPRAPTFGSDGTAD